MILYHQLSMLKGRHGLTFQNEKAATKCDDHTIHQIKLTLQIGNTAMRQACR